MAAPGRCARRACSKICVALAASPQICIVEPIVSFSKGQSQDAPSYARVSAVQLTAGGRSLRALAALFGAAAALMMFVCLTSPAGAAAGHITIVSGGSPRSAILIEHYRLKQSRRPAIIVLRAPKKQGARLRRNFGLEEMARSSGAVLVYPEPQAGHWVDASGLEPNRDTHFVRDLIAKLVSHGIVNPAKVFLVGIGSGGTLALRLACDGKPKFAGVAVVAASLPASLAASCAPPGPIPLLLIGGAAEPPAANHEGKEGLPHEKAELLPVDKTIGLFAKAAGCGEGAMTTILPEKYLRADARAYRDKLNNCAVPVEAVRIEAGGHMAPGVHDETGPGAGLANSGVNGAKLVWDFFRPLGG
jgi:polyhydroxybutyrate depolymerase